MAEGSEHGGERLALLTARLNEESFVPAITKIGFIGKDEVDAVDQAFEGIEFLRLSDIHQDERFPGGVGKCSRDTKRPPSRPEGLARTQMKLPGQGMIDEDRSFVQEKRQEGLCLSLISFQGPQACHFGSHLSVQEGVDA